MAAKSKIAKYPWPGRGVAPRAYTKGMAVVFARTYCKLKAGDPAAIEMAKANTGTAARDALAWYDDLYQKEGMSNAVAGADTLRHLFVLLIGLGMRESSGKYCEGRDMDANNTSANSAEAGLFQTSLDITGQSNKRDLLLALFADYSANSSGFVDIFSDKITCKPSDWKNWGKAGEKGIEFQRLSKACPAFAAEFAAVGLRSARSHWGPINKRAAKVHPNCDAMLIEVQKIVDADPAACSALL
jgi:hypothetical protein